MEMTFVYILASILVLNTAALIIVVFKLIQFKSMVNKMDDFTAELCRRYNDSQLKYIKEHDVWLNTFKSNNATMETMNEHYKTIEEMHSKILRYWEDVYDAYKFNQTDLKQIDTHYSDIFEQYNELKKSIEEMRKDISNGKKDDGGIEKTVIHEPSPDGKTTGSTRRKTKKTT